MNIRVEHLQFRCRICLKAIKKGEKASELIAEVLPDIAEEMCGIPFPETVCGKCHKELLSTRDFIKKIRNAHEILQCIVLLEKQNAAKKLNYWCLAESPKKNMVLLVQADFEDQTEAIISDPCDIHTDSSNENESVDANFDSIASDGEHVDEESSAEEKSNAEHAWSMNTCPEDNELVLGTDAFENSEPKRFLCWFCGKLFKFESKFIRHISSFCSTAVDSCTYLQNRKLVCELCGRRFLHNGHFTRHKKWHSLVDNFTCEICFQKFSTKELYEKHIAIHKSVRSVECLTCHLWFSTPCRLDNHMKTKHSDPPLKQSRGNKNLVGANLEKVTQMCAECGKIYKCPVSYNRHKLTHTGIKNFQCSSCKAAFFTKSELVRHRRYKHEQDEARKYQCSECNISFVEGVRFKTHMMKHKGNRAFSCSKCNKSYFSMSMLRLHEVKKHGARKKQLE